MSREIDLLMLEDLASFSPTQEHTALKLLLQERVSTNVLGKLTISQLHMIEPFIAPFTLDKIENWCERYPGFFIWLLLPDSHQMIIQNAKEAAANTLVELLNLDMSDDSIDPKLAALRLKAAELLIRTDMKREQRINQTLKISGNIPKNLANKNVDALEAHLKKLKE